MTVAPSVSSSVNITLSSVDEHGRNSKGSSNDSDLEVNIQAGEYEVIKSIWSQSLSSLTGFDSLLKLEIDASIQSAIDDAGSKSMKSPYSML